MTKPEKNKIKCNQQKVKQYKKNAKNRKKCLTKNLKPKQLQHNARGEGVRWAESRARVTTVYKKFLPRGASGPHGGRHRVSSKV